MFTQMVGGGGGGTEAETAVGKATTMVMRMGTDAHIYDDPDDVSIAPLLDSRFDSEKTDALKRLLAFIAQGLDVSHFFPHVVKNVASQSLEVKKLVYLYLLHYAEKRPSEALLSINYFQKDLGDTNPLVRAWALRTMAGIRLHVISPLVLIAVEKCARDPSVYVRKCAANALPKLHDLQQDENTKAIEEVIGILLNDNSPGVVGAAASAFMSVCPNNLLLISKSYRKLCETLPDMEEWGQIILIEILLRYAIATHGLVKESIMLSSCDGESYTPENNNSDVISGFTEMVSRSYLEGPEKYISRLNDTDMGATGIESLCFISVNDNDDIKILLQCTSPLLWSHNSAVVVAAAGLHWIMSPKEDVKRIVKPLLFVMRSSSASKYVVLCNIQVFAKAMPHLFAPYFEDFFVSSLDLYQIKALKLEIISSIATDSSISVIFQEFQDYIRDPDRKFAADTIAAIGLCAKKLPKVANTCLEGLLTLIREENLNGEIGSLDGEANVLTQVLISVLEIVSLDPPCHEKAIIQLIRGLELIKVPAACALVIWMVGEYSTIGHVIPKMLPTVLKYLAFRFTSESVEVKLQILNTATKVLLCSKSEDLGTFEKILSYVLELAKCDLNYDIRDRARVLNKLLSFHISPSDVERELKVLENNKDLQKVVANSLLAGKMKPLHKSISYRFYLPGSLSQLVLHAAPGYEPLPKPCSLTFDDTQGSPSGSTSDLTSGSIDEGTTSEYCSQGSDTGGDSENDSKADPLIHFSDINTVNSTQERDDFGDLMSRKNLESWLGGNTTKYTNSPESSRMQRSFARISLKDIGDRVHCKSHKLLDSSVGNGLRVEYNFSSEVSNVSLGFVCVEVYFKNCSMETFSKLNLLEDESSRDIELADKGATSESPSTSDKDVPTLVPMEEITSIEAGQTIKRIVHVLFHHHLKPLKLVIWCNGKKYSVKLRPDIGYFVKPLLMDIELFMSKASQLTGMFEYERSCIFMDHIAQLSNEKGDTSISNDKFLFICETLAFKMLSHANLYLVCVDMPVDSNLDDASGLRLRFSCEILSNPVPCLITVTVDGKCLEPLNLSIKVNCGETVFGLNLLNRVVSFLAEPVSLT